MDYSRRHKSMAAVAFMALMNPLSAAEQHEVRNSSEGSFDSVKWAEVIGTREGARLYLHELRAARGEIAQEDERTLLNLAEAQMAYLDLYPESKAVDDEIRREALSLYIAASDASFRGGNLRKL